MKLLVHSQTWTVAPLKFGNGYVISSQTFLGMGLLIHAGIKVNPWQERIPGYRLTTIYDVTIQRYRKSHTKTEVSKMHILWCMGSKVLCEISKVPLKFHSKVWTHTAKICILRGVKNLTNYDIVDLSHLKSYLDGPLVVVLAMTAVPHCPFFLNFFQDFIHFFRNNRIWGNRTMSYNRKKFIHTENNNWTGTSSKVTWVGGLWSVLYVEETKQFVVLHMKINFRQKPELYSTLSTSQ